MSDLRQAAQAVVDRWDTPAWKDAPHTAEFIDRLRAALAESPMSERERPVEFDRLPATTIHRIHRQARGTDGLDVVGFAWRVEAEAERAIVAQLAALLPGTHYMDPPDGGSVSVMEQLRRMADDAAKWRAARSGQAASGSQENARSDERTGWPPGLLQDDSRELSRALASKPDAMVHARDAVAKIGQPEAPTAAALVRDAARYRFLRDNDKRHFWPPVHGSMWVVAYHQPPGVHAMPETRGAGYGADLDVAIDAAIAAARSGAGSEEGGHG